MTSTYLIKILLSALLLFTLPIYIQMCIRDRSVVVLLFVDTAIFIGLLVVGLVKMDLRGKEVL